MTVLALSGAAEITFSVAGTIIVLGLFVLLRVIFRREPSPPTWRRIRVGLFLERDPRQDDDQPPN